MAAEYRNAECWKQNRTESLIGDSQHSAEYREHGTQSLIRDASWNERRKNASDLSVAHNAQRHDRNIPWASQKQHRGLHLIGPTLQAIGKLVLTDVANR